MYADILNYLMFNPSELGGSDLNGYKSFKAYILNNGWLSSIFNMKL